MSRLMRWVNRFFRLEEINGADRCPTYLYRWTILRLFGCGVYLHRFVGDDWSLDLHDHPKRFVSIGLCGRYFETTPRTEKEFVAPWLRSFPASHVHRLRVYPGEECWTLVIVFRAVRQWGFWNSGLWIPWREYVKGSKSHLADTRAVCANV